MKKQFQIICILLLLGASMSWAQLRAYGYLRTGDHHILNDTLSIRYQTGSTNMYTQDWGGGPGTNDRYDFEWDEWPIALTMHYFVDLTIRKHFLIPSPVNGQWYTLPVEDKLNLTPSEVMFTTTQAISEIGSRVGVGERMIIQPNPAKNMVNIYLPAKTNHGFTLKIYAVNGRLIKTFERVSDTPEISWNLKDETGKKMMAGVYIVDLKTDSGVTRRGKLIIEN